MTHGNCTSAACLFSNVFEGRSQTPARNRSSFTRRLAASRSCWTPGSGQARSARGFGRCVFGRAQISVPRPEGAGKSLLEVMCFLHSLLGHTGSSTRQSPGCFLELSMTMEYFGCIWDAVRLFCPRFASVYGKRGIPISVELSREANELGTSPQRDLGTGPRPRLLRPHVDSKLEDCSVFLPSPSPPVPHKFWIK